MGRPGAMHGIILALPFVERLIEHAVCGREGPGPHAEVEMGRLVAKEHGDRLQITSNPALEKVLTFWSTDANCGCKVTMDTSLEDRFLDRVTRDVNLSRGDTWSSVCPVRAGSFDVAAAMFNEHAYGNGTREFAHRKGRHGRHQRSRSRADGFPFVRRWKASLFGDHHMYGPEDLRLPS